MIYNDIIFGNISGFLNKTSFISNTKTKRWKNMGNSGGKGKFKSHKTFQICFLHDKQVTLLNESDEIL